MRRAAGWTSHPPKVMSETERVLAKVRHGRTDCHLIEPYVLSFATITEISSLWARVEDDRGAAGLGEAVPLPGYADEEAGGIAADFDLLCPLIEGKTFSQAKALLLSMAGDHPFAVSALASAVDLIAWPRPQPGGVSIPLVFPIAAGGDPELVLERMRGGLAAGYRHFKMKTGRNVKDDIVCARAAAAEASSRGATLRFDANQGYGYEEARRFCAEIERIRDEGMLWLEQPLPKDDWDAMERLCRDVAFPLMLDEPIYNAADVERAASIGCAAVKLKLVKHFGMRDTLYLARFARGLGLKVTLGNGVSTDIGNYCEALIIAAGPGLFADGAECNGFVKITQNIHYQELIETGGVLFFRA